MSMKKYVIIVIAFLMLNQLQAQYTEINVPVGTDLQAVKLMVRDLKKEMKQDIVVVLEGGFYFLSETLEFNETDSPLEGKKIVWKNKKNELPQISGGVLLENWENKGDGIVAAKVPGGFNFRQLFVNGKKAHRATFLDDVWARVIYDKANKRFEMSFDEAMAKGVRQWDETEKVEINVISTFVGHQIKINRIMHDSTAGKTYISIDDYTAALLEHNKHFDKSVDGKVIYEYDIYFENAKEFIDRSGEWFFDDKEKVVYYKLLPNESASTIQVIAPKLETLLNIDGAKNLTFFGLSFEHSTWVRPSDTSFVSLQNLYFKDPAIAGFRGTLPVPAAVNVRNSKNIHFERNIFRFTGGTGVMVYDEATLNLAMIGNVFYMTAAAALQLGDDDKKGTRNPQEGLFQPLIQNNYFYKNGLQYSSPVVFGTFPVQLDFSHNELVYSHGMGLNLGWGGNDPSDLFSRPLVQYNKFDSIALLGTDISVYHTRNDTRGARITKNWFDNSTKVLNKRILGRYNQKFNDPKFGNIYYDNDAKNNNAVDNLHTNFSTNGFEWRMDKHYIFGDKGSPNYIIENENYHDDVREFAGLTPEYEDIRNYIHKGSIGRELYPRSNCMSAYIIDDRAPRITYEGKWEKISSNGKDVGPGGYLNTYTTTSLDNSSLTLSFVGEGIEVFGPVSKSPVMVNVSIDGKAVGSYALSGNNLMQHSWFKMFNLGSGSHTLKITKKGGTDLIIDGFQIYPSNP